MNLIHYVLDKLKEKNHELYETKALLEEANVLFLLDPSVPPTNNLAERMGRKFKRKAHQVMSFRSQSGVDYFCMDIIKPGCYNKHL